MQYPPLALLNDWQRGFPLVDRPFAAMGEPLGLAEPAVLRALHQFRSAGKLGRIGAVWARGAGGAAALCALAVPADRLQAVAHLVNREPLCNHNYEREHAWNLWYVLTGRDGATVRTAADRIAQRAEAPSLFLPMVRAYRVDLGFDLRAEHAPATTSCERVAAPVAGSERALAALAEQGLALVPQPYRLWADQLGWSVPQVLQALRDWQAAGTLRRFGVVVRHHDLGIAANAMTVVQVPPARCDEVGARIAAQPGVTLAYRRETDPRWPYNLYFMVHGRERGAVEGLVREALEAAGAHALPHETLFSLRRFKQTGGRYFSEAAEPAEEACA